VLTIVDDDTAGTLQFSLAADSVGEASGTATISVTREGGASGAVSVDYTTANGTATAGVDYAVAAGTLNWADGDGSPKNFSVTITDDPATEGNETVNLSLATPSGGATLGSPATAVLTIVDDENMPPPPTQGGGGCVIARTQDVDFDPLLVALLLLSAVSVCWRSRPRLRLDGLDTDRVGSCAGRGAR
jgi:hypothetical protein